MKTLVLFLAVFVLGFSRGSAEEKREDGVSQSGKIGWHVVETNEDVDVLISEADQGESAANKLCDVPSLANTKVFVSPDDSWIIVQSGGGSLGVTLRVFKRENGMLYPEVSKLDITGAVLKSAFDGDASGAEKLDHVYTRLIEWSADSKSILVSVSGHGGGRTLSPSFAIYDLASQSIGFDLTKFNAKPAHR